MLVAVNYGFISIFVQVISDDTELISGTFAGLSGSRMVLFFIICKLFRNLFITELCITSLLLNSFLLITSRVHILQTYNSQESKSRIVGFNETETENTFKRC